MKEQDPYKYLDLNNRGKWDVIRNLQPKGLNDYTALDLNGPSWEVTRNPVFYERVLQEAEAVMAEESKKTGVMVIVKPYGTEEVLFNKTEVEKVHPIGDIPNRTIDDINAHIETKEKKDELIVKKSFTRREKRALKRAAQGREILDSQVDPAYIAILLDTRGKERKTQIQETIIVDFVKKGGE